MYNVNFKTEHSLYDKFRLVCTINKEKYQDTLTQLIQDYVSKNENLIENPEVQKKLIAELPAFFDKQEKWSRYISRADRNTFGQLATRNNFIRFLLHEYKINNHDDLELMESLHSLTYFKKSDDYKYVSKFGIFANVQGLDPVLMMR